MSDPKATITVPAAEAERLCSQLQAQHRKQWYNPSLWQCWGCATFSQGDPAKMCGQVVGCNLVVARYRREVR